MVNCKRARFLGTVDCKSKGNVVTSERTLSLKYLTTMLSSFRRLDSAQRSAVVGSFNSQLTIINFSHTWKIDPS